MANYLYNGVKLPALPEWDKSAYPYAYIIQNTSADRDWEYRLYTLSSTAVMVEGSNGVGVAQTGVYMGQSYTLNADKSEWGEPVVDRLVLANSFHDGMTPIWCDTDVYYYGTENLYLAASEPVPSIDHTAMVQGWIVGKRLAAMRKREPVAYLYNGVRLPALPEWDKETYPYVVIQPSRIGVFGSYFPADIKASTDPFEVYTSGDTDYLTSTAEVATELRWEHDEENNVWVGQGDAWAWGSGSSTTVPVWTNVDLYHADGSLYLAASEPVPVYE